MADVMIIQGKTETIWDDEDFARMLRDKLGYDAEQYFREKTDVETVLDDLNLTDEDILNHYCSGECDKVQDVQGHFQSVLNEIKELAREVYHQIIDNWHPGSRRTKNEQFAVDKVLEIMKKVDLNT